MNRLNSTHWYGVARQAPFVARLRRARIRVVSEGPFAPAAAAFREVAERRAPRVTALMPIRALSTRGPGLPNLTACPEGA